MKIDPKSPQDVAQVSQAKLATQAAKPVASIKSDGQTVGNQTFSFASSLSQEQLEIMHYLMQNYASASLFDHIDEILQLFTAVQSQEAQEVTQLMNAIREDINILKDKVTIKELSQSTVQKAFEVYRDIEGLKNNLISLLTRLSQQPQAQALRNRVEDFINHLETLKLFNQEGLAAEKNGLVYFPLTVQMEKQHKQNLGIWIKPEFRQDGSLDERKVSFAMSIDSQALGELTVHCQIDGKNISLHANTQNAQAEKLMRDNSSDLARRFKKAKFELSQFSCRWVSGDTPERGILSKIEMTA